MASLRSKFTDKVWLEKSHVKLSMADLLRPRYLAVWVPVVILAYIVLSICYNVWLHPLRNYPGPKAWAATRVPWIYNSMNGGLHRSVWKLHEKYGSVVRIGPKELSYTSGDAWRHIYGNRPVELQKDLRGSGIVPNFGHVDSIASADREDHQRMRRSMAPAFSEKALREQEYLMHNYVDQMIGKLKDKYVEGPQNMVSWYNWCTFDIMGDLSFGEPFGCLEEARYHSWVKSIFDAIKMSTWAQACLTYHILPLLYFITPKTLMDAKAERDRNSYEKTERRMSKEDFERKDFMSYILRNYQAKRLSRAEVHQNAIILIIAGSETTATLLSGLTYHMLRHPRVYRRLVQEIRGDCTTYSSIDSIKTSQLPYLRAVIEESLRIYPPAPNAFPRIISGKDEVIEGKWVAGDTTVGVYQYATSHYSGNFYRSEDFLPERWLPEDLHIEGDVPAEKFANDHKDAMQPFSVGPRNCMGRNLAYAEMRIILSKLLWTFDLALAAETDHNRWLRDQKTYVLWDKPPVMVYLKPRVV